LTENVFKRISVTLTLTSTLTLTLALILSLKAQVRFQENEITPFFGQVSSPDTDQIIHSVETVRHHFNIFAISCVALALCRGDGQWAPLHCVTRLPAYKGKYNLK